jgi:hypothetical protein
VLSRKEWNDQLKRLVSLTELFGGVIPSTPMTIIKSTLSRRSFLAIALAPTLLRQTEKDPWADVSAILDRIKPPKFPARDFKITQFGAVPNSCSTE